MNNFFLKNEIYSKLNVTIAIIEQKNDKPFNLGYLSNIGFHIHYESFDYFCINNVDLLPIHADYSFSNNPVQVLTHQDKKIKIDPFNENLFLMNAGLVEMPDEATFHGCVLINKNIFIKVNGYSLSYWGWGFEDLDMKNRLETYGYQIENRKGKFKNLDHKNLGYDLEIINNEIHRKKTPIHLRNREIFLNKFNGKKNIKDNIQDDGLNKLNYKIIDKHNIAYNNENNKVFSIDMVGVDF